MREKIRNYFIGDYLKKSEDVFEHARAIMLLQFALMFLVVFSLPLATHIALGYEKAIILHTLVGTILTLFPFIIKRIKNLDHAINIFFAITFLHRHLFL